MPITGKGAVIEIFNAGAVAQPDPDIRKMEDGRKTGGDLDKMIESLSVTGKNPLPVRPGYNEEGDLIKVYANYFPVKIKKMCIHKYNVAFTGSQPPQAMKSRLIQLLVEEEELGPSKIRYRTNVRDIIYTTEAITYRT